MKRAIGAVSILLALSSCELTEKQCTEGDWATIGQRDGQNGRDQDFISKHIKTCSKYGIQPNQSLWEKGRQQGLLVYCTPQNAYEVGANGLNLRNVCPAKDLEVLLKANKRGQKYHQINQEIDSLISERRDLGQELAQLGTEPDDIARRNSIRSRISWINLEIQILAADRRRYAEY